MSEVKPERFSCKVSNDWDGETQGPRCVFCILFTSLPRQCVCVATEGLLGRDKQALPGCVHDFPATYFLFLEYFTVWMFFPLVVQFILFLCDVVLQISSGESVTICQILDILFFPMCTAADKKPNKKIWSKKTKINIYTHTYIYINTQIKFSPVL